MNFVQTTAKWICPLCDKEIIGFGTGLDKRLAQQDASVDAKLNIEKHLRSSLHIEKQIELDVYNKELESYVNDSLL